MRHVRHITQREQNIALPLRVTDAAGGDVGSLSGWSLELSRRTQDVFGVDNPCSADVDQSGTVSVNDLFAFLGAWFAQNGLSGPSLSADFDNSGAVSVNDLFAFLGAWFAQNGVCG